MMHNLLCKLPLLSIVLFLLVGCNERTQTNDANTTANDTTAKVVAEIHETPAYDASQGVTAVAPALYNRLADTLGIRVLEATYKPGDSSIVHAHPDFAMYVLEGGTIELTSTEGNKQVIEFKKGMGIVLPAESHAAKNIGKTTLRLVVVEADRPRN